MTQQGNRFWIPGLAMLSMLLLLARAGEATVKPPLSDIVKQSDLVITGKVTKVDGDPAGTRQVTVQIVDVIKGTRPAGESISLAYERVGKGNIDFGSMQGGAVSIFFLKSSSGSWQLADAWFGVEEATGGALAEVRAAAGSP